MAALASIAPIVSFGLNFLKSRQASRATAAARNVALSDAQAQIDATRRAADGERLRRRLALRRVLARTRARLGAQGVGSGPGSGQALLLGLLSEGKQEDRRIQDSFAGRVDAVNRRLGRSLLRTEEARARNRLDLLRLGLSKTSQTSGLSLLE